MTFNSKALGFWAPACHCDRCVRRAKMESLMEEVEMVPVAEDPEAAAEDVREKLWKFFNEEVAG